MTTVVGGHRFLDRATASLEFEHNPEEAFPLVSLIVVNHNGKSKLKGLLDNCLSSLLQTDYPNFEIIFVDNASNDGTPEYVEAKFNSTRIRMVRLESNMGYSGATNHAIGLAEGDIIGVLNNDIGIVDASWLTTLVKFMMDEPGISIVSPALLWDDNRIDSLGGEVNVLMIAWDAHSREYFEGRNNRPIIAMSPPGAAFLFRRSVADRFRNEIFESDYFAYYEDVCLGLKMNLMGERVAVVPQSVIRHKRGSSWGLFSPQKYFLMRRNSIWTGITIFETGQVVFLLPVWLASTFYGSLVYYRLTKDPKFFLTPFKVIGEVLASMPKVWARHEQFHGKKSTATNSLRFSRNLILDSDRLTFFRRMALTGINVMIRLAGLSKFTITRIKRYPLVDPSYLAQDN
jgi:GT2 family glycosyltransferase